jgi:lysophospholipase L1-like esterase
VATILSHKILYQTAYHCQAEIVRRIRADFEARGIEYVEALEEMSRGVAAGEQLYPYSTQSHPDSPGYERIARAVAHALEERGFEPGR